MKAIKNLFATCLFVAATTALTGCELTFSDGSGTTTSTTTTDTSTSWGSYDSGWGGWY